jgi:hypothetical protein
MKYLIKLDGQEIATLTGARIQFGRKMASGSLMEKEVVEDRNILKGLDAGGNTLWEGLWIYVKEADGFRGYAPAGCFPKDDPELKAAEDMVRGTGISVGAYGQG